MDQYLNIKLLNVTVVEPEKFPHMVRMLSLATHPRSPIHLRDVYEHCTVGLMSPLLRPFLAFAQQSVKHCFVRGSVIRYAQLPKADIDVELLQDATRKEAQQQRAAK